jgi:hypothetical protein
MTITARYVDTCLSDYLQDGYNRPGQTLCLANLGCTLEETVDALYDSISDFESIPESIEEEAIKTALRDELHGGVDLRWIDGDGNPQDEIPEDLEDDCVEEPYLYVVLEWDATTITMVLNVEVTYLANGTNAIDLKRGLETMVQNHLGDNLYDCPAVVTEWGASAHVKGEEPGAK